MLQREIKKKITKK